MPPTDNGVLQQWNSQQPEHGQAEDHAEPAKDVEQLHLKWVALDVVDIQGPHGHGEGHEVHRKEDRDSQPNNRPANRSFTTTFLSDRVGHPTAEATIDIVAGGSIRRRRIQGSRRR